MSDLPQSNENNEDKEGYSKDINLLPEDLRHELKATGSSHHKTSYVKPEKSHKPKPEDPSEPGFLTWLKSFFQAKDQAVPAKAEVKSKPVKFKASVKPNLQVDVKTAEPKSVEEEINFIETEQPPIPPPPPPTPKPSPAPSPSAPLPPPPPPQPTPQPKPDKPFKADTKEAKPAESTIIYEEKKKKSTFDSIREMINKDSEAQSQEFEVNLIPSEYFSANTKRRVINQLLIFGIVSVTIVILLYLGVSIIGADRQQQIREIQTKIEGKEAEIAQSEDVLKQLTDFTKQTRLVSEVLIGQKKLSGAFKLLEEIIIDEVYFENANISDGKISLSVQARSYHDLARQILILRNRPDIDNVTVTGGTLNIELWNEYLESLEAIFAERTESGSSGLAASQDLELPGFEEMKKLLTVTSNISFTYVLDKSVGE